MVVAALVEGLEIDFAPMITVEIHEKEPFTPFCVLFYSYDGIQECQFGTMIDSVDKQDSRYRTHQG